MKIKLLLVLTFSWLIAACANMLAVHDLPDCNILISPPDCSNPEGNPNAPVVNFNKNSLNLTPPNVCAKKGKTIEFKITPASGPKNQPGSVAIVAKNAADTWLFGSNSADSKEILIPVPDHVEADKYYEYTIVSVIEKTVSCVDPRVHVEP